MKTAKELIDPKRLAAAEVYLEDKLLQERGLNDIETQKAQVQMGVLLGSVGVLQQLGEMTTQKALMILMQIRDGKGYTAFGYGRFDDFLNDPDKTKKFGILQTMNYAQFNRLETLYKKEGPQVFNLLNGAVPDYIRRQLPTGSFDFDPATGMLRVGETAVPVDDKNAVVDAVRALHSQMEAATAKAEAQSKQLESIQKSLAALQANPDKAKGKPAKAASALTTAKLQYAGATSELAELCANLSEDERTALSRFVDNQYYRINEALQVPIPEADPEADEIADRCLEAEED